MSTSLERPYIQIISVGGGESWKVIEKKRKSYSGNVLYVPERNKSKVDRTVGIG